MKVSVAEEEEIPDQDGGQNESHAKRQAAAVDTEAVKRCRVWMETGSPYLIYQLRWSSPAGEDDSLGAIHHVVLYANGI